MSNVAIMYERQSEQMWEEQNAPVIDGETLRQVDRSLRFAIEELDKACDDANEVCEILADTPFGDRVASVLHDMEDLLCDLKTMQKNAEKGEL